MDELKTLQTLSPEQKCDFYQRFLRIVKSDKIIPITDNLIIAEHAPETAETIVKRLRTFDPLFELLNTNKGEFFGSKETAEKLSQKFGGNPILLENNIYAWVSPDQMKYADSNGHISFDNNVLDFNTAAVLLAEGVHLRIIKKIILIKRYDSREKLEEIARGGFVKVLENNPELEPKDFILFLDTWNSLYTKYKNQKCLTVDGEEQT